LLRGVAGIERDRDEEPGHRHGHFLRECLRCKQRRRCGDDAYRDMLTHRMPLLREGTRRVSVNVLHALSTRAAWPWSAETGPAMRLAITVARLIRKSYFFSAFFSSSSARGLSVSSSFDLGMRSTYWASCFSRGRRSRSFFSRSASGPAASAGGEPEELKRT